MKSEEADQLIKLLQSFKEETALPLPPPPEEVKEKPNPYKDYKGILINGVPPKAPKSFFESKLFLIAASGFALLCGGLAYALFLL